MNHDPHPGDRDTDALHPDGTTPKGGGTTSSSTPEPAPELKTANGHDPQAEIDQLAAMDELDYDRLDEAAKAVKAEQLRLKNAAALDRAVGRVRKAAKAKAETEARTAKVKADADRRKAEAEEKEKAKQLPPLTETERAALLEHLADLDPIDYSRERHPAKKRLGISEIDVLDTKVDQIRLQRRLQNPPPPKVPTPDTPEVTALITEFNALYFVLREHGTAIIYAEKFDPILNRRFYERITFGDLDKLYFNRTVLSGYDKTGEPVYERVAQVWLHHRNRQQYIKGLVFDPSGRKPDEGVYNLFRGFGVTPRQGSWEKLANHIGVIICNNDPEHFYYVMDWMADFLRATPGLPKAHNSEGDLGVATLWPGAPHALISQFRLGHTEAGALMHAIDRWKPEIAPLIAKWMAAGAPSDTNSWYARVIPAPVAAARKAEAMAGADAAISRTVADIVAAIDEPRIDPSCRAARIGPIRHHGAQIWPPPPGEKYSFDDAWYVITIWRAFDRVMMRAEPSPKTRAAMFMKPIIGCFRNLNPQAGEIFAKLLWAQNANPDLTGPDDNECPPYDSVQ